MKKTIQYLSIGVAAVVIALVLFIAVKAASIARSTPIGTGEHANFLVDGFGAGGPGKHADPGGREVIPLKPIAGLTSLNATVNITLNGLINSECAQGDLNALLTTNDQGKS